MSQTIHKSYQQYFPHCRHALGEDAWGRVCAARVPHSVPAGFADDLQKLKTALALPGWIDDLARVEWAVECLRQMGIPPAPPPERLTVNPALHLVPVGWRGLDRIFSEPLADAFKQVSTGAGHVMVWAVPDDPQIRVREAGEADLLALKLVVDGVDPRQAAQAGAVPVAAIQAALHRAVTRGLLRAPASRIRRVNMAADEIWAEEFRAAGVFTLQWHITQACDLHCRHCYDRSDRTPLALETALAILDDFYDFCRRMHVQGQVTFTGGNPLLYPHFCRLYRTAVDLGFTVAILGNPASRARMEEILEIARPAFFQISLEGLADYNDHIRGRGHFQRSLAFLDLLGELEIYRMVMLTLNRDNLAQVIPLGKVLRGRTETFTFNRLAAVGEGAQLAMPAPADFERFLRAYRRAASANPVLTFKDNLFNLIQQADGKPLMGGCTGYGCGAAFNFVSLLADGEVHACRKFPSPIGNLTQDSLMAIYDSDRARRYREGSLACQACPLRMVCRGCLAVTHSLGLDVFAERDPFCFGAPTVADA